MKQNEFEKLVQTALSDIPDEFMNALENIAITVEDEPKRDIAIKLGLAENDILLGLYQGIPLKKRSTWYGNVMPDKITLFKKSIERLYKTPEAIKKAVRKTVIHEIAHYFGIGDARLKELGI
ncbi:MAG: metallopeptidase family protein [Candidatus Ancaeobacter aquaticus]|nr:metallopeptidase family protein [Candidatus Ancaeobacter aquaticus]